MPTVFLPGKSLRVYYSAVAHRMTLGTMSETAEPAVILVYGREEALVIALIVSEMKSKGMSPELFFEMRDPGDVIVLFRLLEPSLELIRRVTPDNAQVRSAATQKGVELIATGESDFEFEGLRKYLLPASQQGISATLIIENPTGDIVVTVPIKKIMNGKPSL